MEVLQSLGINQTVFFQFIIFAIALVALIEIAFKPYAEACEAREQKTKGSVENVAHLETETQALLQKYEVEAKQVASQVKQIFDRQRDEARKEVETISQKAKDDAAGLLGKTRAELETQMQAATAQAKNDVPQLVKAMVDKLLA